ncbi:MAG: Flp family type IVb pilin [Candidatus Eremiobacteraeota bacterium]|nr:Flp family type IVb pilin [Candidatus Eremiobacteraeota bacterium]MBC5801536.1 Flp family type IVb pilin [Candidatus Eremiobacteraeota bacterium]MBC5822835.1 Flp family type IVb pilin [Candidatus Eremiobacteraeota bacterium]
MPRLLGDDSGQGLLEYAIIIAFVALVAVGVVTLFGKKTVNSLNNSAALVPN